MTSLADRTEHGLQKLLLLEELDQQKHVSQRRLGESLGVATSLVNRLIAELRDDGHLEVVDPEVRPFAYRLTSVGRRYRGRLSREHCRTVLESYQELRRRIRRRLEAIRDDGVERLAFYGAGQVMEMATSAAQEVGLRVVGVVDADPQVHGTRRNGHPVAPPSALEELDPDGVLVTGLFQGEGVRDRVTVEVGSDVPVLDL